MTTVFEKSLAALEGKGIQIVESDAYAGRYDNMRKIVLNNNNNRPALRLATMRFRKNGKALEVDLMFDPVINTFYPQTGTYRVYTTAEGKEIRVSESHFFGSFKRTGFYTILADQHKIDSIEEFNALPAAELDILGTYDRGHFAEVMRQYLYDCKYRIQGKDIEDVRKLTEGQKKVGPEEADYIAEQANSFVSGSRGYKGEPISVPESEDTNNPESQVV